MQRIPGREGREHSASTNLEHVRAMRRKYTHHGKRMHDELCCILQVMRRHPKCGVRVVNFILRVGVFDRVQIEYQQTLLASHVPASSVIGCAAWLHDGLRGFMSGFRWGQRFCGTVLD